MSADDATAKRARLAERESGLEQLRARYDLLMNGFRFEEARALVPRIEAIEHEVDALAKTLPPSPTARAAPYTVGRGRRRRRR